MAFIKFFHILFIIVWMGTLFVLTYLISRLSKEEALLQKKLASIYQRLYLLVDRPAMLLALFLGLALVAVKGADFKAGWFHMKMTFMLFLVGCDLMTGLYLRRILTKELPFGRKRFKVLHGVTLFCLMGVMASLYLLKPKFNI